MQKKKCDIMRKMQSRGLNNAEKKCDFDLLTQAGKDSEKVYDFGTSPLDIYARIRKSVPEAEFINLGKSLYQAISDLTPELGPRAVILLVSGDVLPNAFNQYELACYQNFQVLSFYAIFHN